MGKRSSNMKSTGGASAGCDASDQHHLDGASPSAAGSPGAAGTPDRRGRKRGAAEEGGQRSKGQAGSARTGNAEKRPGVQAKKEDECCLPIDTSFRSYTELPAGIFTTFFKYLDRNSLLQLGSTCQLLRSLALSTSACWKHLDIRLKADNDPKEMGALNSVAPLVEKFHISLPLAAVLIPSPTALSKEVIREIIRALPVFENATRLDVGSPDFRKDRSAILKLLSSRLPNLTSVDYYVGMVAPPRKLDMFELIRKSWPQAVSLGLDLLCVKEWDQLGSATMKFIRQAGRSGMLCRLYFQGDQKADELAGVCETLKLEGIRKNLTELHLEVPCVFDAKGFGMIGNLHSLTILELVAVCRKGHTRRVGTIASDFWPIIEQLPSLRDLAVQGNFEGSPQNLVEFFRRAQFNLVKLQLLKCRLMSDLVVRALVDFQPSLEHLSITEYSGDEDGGLSPGALATLRSLPKLGKLELLPENSSQHASPLSSESEDTDDDDDSYSSDDELESDD